MTYERNEDLIIAALDLILAILKGGKKIRTLLQKRKKQASTSATKDTDMELTSSEPSEAEVNFV